MAPEIALYYIANLALFGAVLVRWWSVWQRDRVGNKVLQGTLILFVIIQGAALIWSTAVAGLLSIAHPWLATMGMLEAAIVWCLFRERGLDTRAPGAIVVTLGFMLHSRGLVVGPLPLWQDLTISPFARSLWYLIHVLSALVACGAYVCAVGGALANVAALMPRRSDSPTRAAMREDGRTFAWWALIFASPWLTGSIFAHAVWTYLAWGTYWSWRLAEIVLIIVWLILVATLHAGNRSRWQGTISALLTTLGLVLFLASLPLLGQGMVTTL